MQWSLRHTQMQIYYEEFAPMIMEPEESHDLPLQAEEFP
jgi:hypothetical protein